MKQLPSVRALTRSLKGLFGTQKGVNPHKRYPIEYHWHCYFNKQMSDGVYKVSLFEGLSKKDAAELLMTKGFQWYMEEKIYEYNNSPEFQDAIHSLQRKRFIREFKRWAHEMGVDVSLFFKNDKPNTSAP